MKEKGIATAVIAAVIVVALVVAGIGAYFLMKPGAEEGEGEEVGTEWFQTGNTLLITQLQPKQSSELENNRIGNSNAGGLRLSSEMEAEGWEDRFADQMSNQGLKWCCLSLDDFDWAEAESTGRYSRYHIDPIHDKYITDLANNGIKIIYCLVFWDEEIRDNMGKEGYSRFKTEDEIQRYLNYTRFIVNHFKDRIEYYQILNEPESPIAPSQCPDVEPSDYVNLVNRTIPVIREEYPEAKIVAGATSDLEYLFSILNSDVMPLVDAVSWHPMYGTSPESEPEHPHGSSFCDKSYYEYPSIVENIKDVASAHGFQGEYIAEEMSWRTPINPAPHGPIYSETVAAKYYARVVVMHLGMNVTAGVDQFWPPIPERAIRNLCTIMAGAEPTSLSMEIQSEAENIRSYSFSLPSGDKLIALWTDGVAVDEDPGVNADLTCQGFTAQDVTGIDVLTGYQQSIIASNESGNLVIQNLLVRDYPLILHITESS